MESAAEQDQLSDSGPDTGKDHSLDQHFTSLHIQPSPIPFREKHFESTDHCSTLLKKMEELRPSDYDVEIIVNGSTIKAHKIVLKANSGYFLGLFNSGMQESQTGKIEIHDFDADIIEKLVNFMYMGILVINSENVYSLFQAADMYDVERARVFCCDFLTNSLSQENCFELYESAKLYNNEKLKSEVIKFISCHLPIISKTSGFLTLTRDVLFEIFSSNYFMFAGENESYKSIVAWIKHDERNREKDLSFLFTKLICLEKLSKKFLIKHIRQEKIINNCVRCKEFIMEGYERFLLPEDKKKDGHTLERDYPLASELTFTDQEDIEPGPNVKVFDHIVPLLGVEFHLTQAAVNRARTMPNVSGYKFELRIFTWCETFKDWQMLGSQPCIVHIGIKRDSQTETPKIQIPFGDCKKRFGRATMTKHLKIHINHAQQQSIRISYVLPKILKNLNENSVQ